MKSESTDNDEEDPEKAKMDISKNWKRIDKQKR